MKSVLLLIALLAPLSALADTPNFDYDYLDVGHLGVSTQNGQDGKGPYADLSYSIIDELQLRASYEHLDYSTTPFGSTAKDYTLGITAESRALDGTDVYTDILYVNERNASTGVVTTESGYRLTVGMRHAVLPKLELDGYLTHDYLNVATNEVGIGLLFNATSWLSLGAGYAHDSLYNNTTTLKLRLYF